MLIKYFTKINSKCSSKLFLKKVLPVGIKIFNYLTTVNILFKLYDEKSATNFFSHNIYNHFCIIHYNINT